MKEKLVLIGAGSAMFTGALVTDVVKRGWDCELALVDTDPEALAVAEGLTRKVIAAKRARTKLSASTDRREVLRGATAVVTTIAVGGRRAWEQDVFIPRRYGIFQPVGDSVMPGGTSRCLRMIPPMVGIAEDVLDLAPEALFFNYSNPMTAICRAVRKATGAPIVGLCSGVSGIGEQLRHMVGAAPEDFRYTAVGLNHLTWFTEVRVKGEDALPRLQALADEELAKRSPSLVWRLFKLFGAYPAVGDGHVLEFFPTLFAEGTFTGKRIGVEWHPFESIIANGDRIYAQMREMALSKEPIAADYFEHAGGEGEKQEVTHIVESIRGDEGRVFSTNVPNCGQSPNLPEEAVLEGPTMATGAGLKPIAQRPLPPAIAGTLAPRLAWAETVVEAALEGDRRKVVQALILDGWVKSVEMAHELGDELLAAHAKYLPQFGR
jgi:alpha-galactosidase